MKILIIIPVFNEEKNIEKSLQSFINQTFPISQIIIVDDGSTDNTSEIGIKISKLNKNVKFIKKNDSKSIASPGKKIIEAFNFGLKHSNSDFDLIGKFDGDIILPKNYFEYMVEIFKNDNKIGLASGILEISNNKSWKLENLYNEDHVRGGIKLYRKEIFKKIKGLSESLGWDTLDEYKIRFNDYKIYVDKSLRCKQLRKTGERYENKKFYKQGRVMYILGYDFFLCVIGSIKFSIQNKSIFPFAQSIIGYLTSSLNKEKKLVNNNFSKFVRSYRYKMMFKKINQWIKF